MNLNEKLDKHLQSIREASNNGWTLGDADSDEVVAEKTLPNGTKLQVYFIHTRGTKLEDIDKKVWNVRQYKDSNDEEGKFLGKFYLKDLSNKYQIPFSFETKLKALAKDVVNNYN